MQTERVKGKGCEKHKRRKEKKKKKEENEGENAWRCGGTTRHTAALSGGRKSVFPYLCFCQWRCCSTLAHCMSCFYETKKKKIIVIIVILRTETAAAMQRGEGACVPYSSPTAPSTHQAAFPRKVILSRHRGQGRKEMKKKK